MNVRHETSEPVENIYWISAPVGQYKFYVHNCTSNAVDFWIREKHKGVVKMHRGRTDQSDSKSHNFFLDYRDPLQVAAPTRLQTTIDCICDIVQNQLRKEDQIGLMTFATDVRTDVPMTEKEGNERSLLDKVRKMRTRGKTKFYGAVREATEKLKTLDGKTPKWIVALTDGKDTSSDPSDVRLAAENFRATSNLNFALVSFGNEVDLGQVNQMIQGAKAAGSEGMLVSANSISDVQKAFERIGEAITMPTGGGM